MAHWPRREWQERGLAGGASTAHTFTANVNYSAVKPRPKQVIGYINTTMHCDIIAAKLVWPPTKEFWEASFDEEAENSLLVVL